MAFSLYTGLAGDFGLMEWHQRSGFAVLALLAFRLGWGAWGGRYARLNRYVTTPRRVAGWFLEAARRRRPPPLGGGRPEDPHTPPGIALVAALFLAVMAQAITGLFATDDIFIQGPLHRHVEDDVAATMNWIHHRAFWIVLALVGTHLAAHAVYAALKDPTPLAMITGKKAIAAPATPQHLLRGAATLGLTGALCYIAWLLLS